MPRSSLLISSVTALILLVALAVFFSPLLAILAVLGLTAVILTILRPLWMLVFLSVLLPFEPFLLKWVPDEAYLFARLFSEFLIYALFIVAVGRQIISGQRFPKSPITFPFFMLLLALFASAVINLVNPVVAIFGLRQIIRFLLIFFVIILLKPSRLFLRRFLILMFTIVAIVSVIGISQAIIGAPFDELLLPSVSRSFGEFTLTEGTLQFWEPGTRVFATLGRYDRLGTFLAFFLLLALAILYEKKLRDRLPMIYLIFPLALVTLALTFSRSAWFGFLFGAFFLTVILKRDRRVLFGTLAGTAALVLYLVFSGILVNQLVDVPGQTLPERFFEAFSYERWRGEYYGLGRLFWIVQTMTTVWPAAPIFGWGPGQYGGGAAILFRQTRVFDELGLPYGVYGTEGYIDNNWFSILGETGIIGFGFFLWLYLALFIYAVRLFHRSSDPLTRAVSSGFATAMIAVALNAFLATFFEVRSLSVYLWMIGGAVVVLGTGSEELKEMKESKAMV